MAHTPWPTKTIFNWPSRINPKVFQYKDMKMLATSPGPGGASNVLTTATASVPYFDGNGKANISIPSFYDNFDSNQGSIKNNEINEQLLSAVSSLFKSNEVF